MGCEKHAGRMVHAGRYVAPQNEIDPIFDEFGFEYATAGRVDDQSELNRMNEICRIKGRAGVGLLSTLPVDRKAVWFAGLEEDVDSGRWIEADVQNSARLCHYRGLRVCACGKYR